MGKDDGLRKELMLFALILYCRYNEGIKSHCDAGTVHTNRQFNSLYFMRESKIVEVFLVLMS